LILVVSVYSQQGILQHVQEFRPVQSLLVDGSIDGSIGPFTTHYMRLQNDHFQIQLRRK
jgi:hypothetical protein